MVSMNPAREQERAPAGTEGNQPLGRGFSRRRRDLELHGPLPVFCCITMSLGCQPARRGRHRRTLSFTRSQPLQLAVDAQVEHGKIAVAALDLKADSKGPDVLRLQGTLLPDQYVPYSTGVRCREEVRFSVIVVASDAGPVHRSTGSPSTGYRSLLEMGAVAPKADAPTPAVGPMTQATPNNSIRSAK